MFSDSGNPTSRSTDDYTSLIQICRRLIRQKSYSGDEESLVREIESICRENGVSSCFRDSYGNCIISIKGKHPGKSILLDAHVDTVPADETQWSLDPFEAEVRDGKIYGRGSSDMKGALAAMLWAVFKFHKKYKDDFAGEIHIAAVVHEECFEGIAARQVSKRVQPDLVIIGEASDLNLKTGQRGRAEIVLETFGINAHSANPEKGHNAVYDMMRIIPEIRKIPLSSQKELGLGILELTDIKSSPYPGASVVPDYCRATFDRRLLCGETPESVLAAIQNVLDNLKQKDSHLKVEVSISEGRELCYTGETIEGKRFFPGWYFPESSPFVQTALKGLRDADLCPELDVYSFCTNGSHYAGEACIPTLGFGPSSEHQAHMVDEYIKISQLEGAGTGYEALLESFLK